MQQSPLERYSRIIQAKSTLLDAVTIADHIDDIIINTGLRVVAHADGFCFINHTSLENALCRTEGIGLDPVKRKDTICMNCPIRANLRLKLLKYIIIIA